LLGGLRVAAPNAVLGAILAEFGSGARFGLGTYLLGSLGRAEPDRLWGIGLVATLIAGLAYAIAALAAARVTGARRPVTIAALAETLPFTVLGMAAGLGFALLLAIAGAIAPAIVRGLMPIALVTQTMPLVALTPLLVLVFGRGVAVTIAITISVTFFPAYVT